MLLLTTIVKFNSGNDMGRVLGEMTRGGKQRREKFNFPVKREQLHQSTLGLPWQTFKSVWLIA